MSQYVDAIELGSVSLKWVRYFGDGKYTNQIIRHEGDPESAIRRLDDQHKISSSTVIVGASTKTFLDYPYLTESECISAVLKYYALNPDIVLSLGGENFLLYSINKQKVTGVHTQSKCAAGTGEFFLQQLKRMNLSLEEGLKLFKQGKDVEMASRCSVYFKSDATHKLNSGECVPADVVKALLNNLVEKVIQMIAQVDRQASDVVLSGGISQIPDFVELLKMKAPDTNVILLPTSAYIESFGASLIGSKSINKEAAGSTNKVNYVNNRSEFKNIAPLYQFEDLVTFLPENRQEKTYNVQIDDVCILGVDAGSTTTKAVLYNCEQERVIASCYGRTFGNPIKATQRVIKEIFNQVGTNVKISFAGVTGSGRDIVSIFLDKCYSFNEILAHARASAQENEALDTVFEIGGQDSKFISFNKGMPVDYAMNEGCSAGTGSFLEEAVLIDLGIPLTEISKVAVQSDKPIQFGERCAAFINTNIRDALQKGGQKSDVVSGLVYSIAQNYLSKVVGLRQLGDKILFQGGVALNKSVALALAALTKKEIIVPQYPELMGAVGVCLLINDKIKKDEATSTMLNFQEILTKKFERKGKHTCKSCNNHCVIDHYTSDNQTKTMYGGLCSKYETTLKLSKAKEPGTDLVKWRNSFMFHEQEYNTDNNYIGTIAIPMALSTFELFPFYAKLWNLLGFRVLAEEPKKKKKLNLKTTTCYPIQVMLERVSDLANNNADYVFVPEVVQWEVPNSAIHSYSCPSTAVIGGLSRFNLKAPEEKYISVYIDLSDKKMESTIASLKRYSKILKVEPNKIRKSVHTAFAHFLSFKRNYLDEAKKLLKSIDGEPTIVLSSRPYVGYSLSDNMNLSSKISKRGFHVIPADIIEETKDYKHNRNVWHYPQQIMNSVALLKQSKHMFGCFVSCFSCGPDVSLYHLLRKELVDQVFCYLEIDAHTAHAGFDTRLNAFLDLIEENHLPTIKKAELVSEKASVPTNP